MNIVERWISPLFVVTITYFITFYLTFFVFFPLQESIFGAIPFYANLLFLPHGIRLLAALFFGWRSIVFLTPSALLTHYYLNGDSGLEYPTILAAVVGIFCAIVSFEILKRFGIDVQNDDRYKFNWRYLLIAGMLASTINSIGTNYFFNGTLTLDLVRGIISYMIGDVSGQFFVMLTLMFIFRWARIGRK